MTLSLRGAEGGIGSGSSRSAGRVLGGGLTSSARGVEDVDEVEGTRLSLGCAEVDGRL